MLEREFAQAPCARRAGLAWPIQASARPPAADRRSGKLVQLFPRQTLDVRQSIHAVYYRNTALAARITCFVEHVVGALGRRAFEE